MKVSSIQFAQEASTAAHVFKVQTAYQLDVTDDES
jgi:hypothetical protein